MVMKQYRVMIVDDHPLMRRGIKQLLGLDARFGVVAIKILEEDERLA